MSYAGRNPNYRWINLEPQSVDPASPNEGDIFYSDGTPRLEGPWVYVNGAWQQFSTGAALTTVDKITFTAQASDPASPVSGTTFNSNGTPRAQGLWTHDGSGFVQITGQRYREFVVKPHTFVRVASTANLILANQVENGDTIDGVVLATGDLVLLKNQTTTSENGVYVVQASGAPVRSASYDSADELTRAQIIVTRGTVNKNTQWFQNNTLTSLSDAQSWSTTLASESWTVPAGVYEIDIEAVGGGGGGGGASRTDGAGQGGSGAGGAGATPAFFKQKVTPGTSLTIAVGPGGRGGMGDTPAPSGQNGFAGTNTIVSGPGFSYTFFGGAGGQGGVYTPSGTNPVGGSTLSGAPNDSLVLIQKAQAGGNGKASTAAGGGPGNGLVGQASFYAAAGAAATGPESDFGGGRRARNGGSGGAGRGPGGAGGNTSAVVPPAQPNDNNAPQSSGGGGGGGGTRQSDGSEGHRGGLGGSGYVKISW